MRSVGESSYRERYGPESSKTVVINNVGNAYPKAAVGKFTVSQTSTESVQQNATVFKGMIAGNGKGKLKLVWKEQKSDSGHNYITRLKL